MQGNIKFKFNSKEKDLYFIPENFDDLKDSFSNLFDEKITDKISFIYLDENDEIYIDSEGYNTFLEYVNKNENAIKIFVTYENHSLGNYFSNISVESEYPEKEKIEDNKFFSLNDEISTESIIFKRDETHESKNTDNEEVSQNNNENIEKSFRKDIYMKQLEKESIIFKIKFNLFILYF